MKASTTFFTVLLTVFVFTSSFAYTGGGTDPEEKEYTVKLLPAPKGIVKLLYVNDDAYAVTVKISGVDGLIMNDHIRVSKKHGGFVKNYDVNDLAPGTYYIQISEKDMTTKYEFQIQPNMVVWATVWNRLLPKGQAIAAN